jgi:hypothetical protein
MIAPDAIERLRDTMAGQTGGGMTCMDADDARAILDHITALTAERDAAVAEVAEWRECAQYDATMEGPVFKGWDRSQMDRCRKRFNEAGAHE